MSDNRERDVIPASVVDEAWIEYLYPRTATGARAEPTAGFRRAVAVFERWASAGLLQEPQPAGQPATLEEERRQNRAYVASLAADPERRKRVDAFFAEPCTDGCCDDDAPARPAVDDDTVPAGSGLPGWVRMLGLTDKPWGHWCCQAGAVAHPGSCPFHSAAVRAMSGEGQ